MSDVSLAKAVLIASRVQRQAILAAALVPVVRAMSPSQLEERGLSPHAGEAIAQMALDLDEELEAEWTRRAGAREAGSATRKEPTP